MAAPLITGMPTSTASVPTMGITHSMARHDTTMHRAAMATTRHSRTICLMLMVVPMLNSTMPVAALASWVRPAWSMMSAGIHPARNATRNSSMTIIMPDSLPPVKWPIKSPTAKITTTTMR